MNLFKGVKVIDFTHAYAGPFCTQILADYGAEVIKIERVDGGDQARTWGPFKNGYSAYYASFNRGKKSLTLDITSKEGQKIIYNLIKEADIVCSNFKAGTLEKYGVGYESIKKIKPDIIYASISGFGKQGPFSKNAAYDNVVQAMSGVMDVNGFPEGIPTKIGPAIGDSYSGLMLLMGIMVAYYNRLNTGLGQCVDASMLGSLFGTLEYPVLEYANKNNVLTRRGNTSPYYAPGDVFKVKDGFVALSVKNDKIWQEFCSRLDLTEIGGLDTYRTNEMRLKNNRTLKKLLEHVFSEKTKAELEQIFSGSSVPIAGVMGIAEALEDEHLKYRNMVIEVEDPMLGKFNLVGNPICLSENQPVLNVPSPLLGEHTDSILAGMDYDKTEIAKLHERKIV